MDIELFKAGCLIMVIGMSFVFFFLCIMISFMEITSKLVKFFSKYSPEKTEENTTPSAKQKNNDAEIALAITCALLNRNRA